MMRKFFLVCCLVAFAVGTVVGCSQAPSNDEGTTTAPPSVTAEQ